MADQETFYTKCKTIEIQKGGGRIQVHTFKHSE